MKRRYVIVEDEAGHTLTLRKLPVDSGSDGRIAVKAKDLSSGFLLLPQDKRELKLGVRKLPVWLVKDGRAASTVVHARNGRGQAVSAELAEVETKWLPDEDGRFGHLEVPEKKTIDSHYFYDLLDDKSVGNYISAKAFIPVIQGLIVVGAILAGIAAVLGFFAWDGTNQLADQLQAQAHLIEQMRQSSGGFNPQPTIPQPFPVPGG